jgi:hypothetical protein
MPLDVEITVWFGDPLVAATTASAFKLLLPSVPPLSIKNEGVVASLLRAMQ